MGKTRDSANLVSDNNIKVDIDNDRVGIGTSTPAYDLDVVGDVNFSGTLYQDGSEFTVSSVPYATNSGISTVSEGLTGTPNITVGSITATTGSFSGNVSVAGTLTYEDVTNVDSIGIITARSNLTVLGITTSNETRFLSVAEKILRVDGNTVSIAYTSTGANIGLCTNPSGNITLAVTNIPTDDTFDNHAISFSIFVNQTGTARSCTAVTLNGVSKSIKWAGGSLSDAISGVTTTNGYDIYNFVGINTIGSATTTTNYEVLGVVNGGFR